MITAMASRMWWGTGSLVLRGQVARRLQSQSRPARKTRQPAKEIPILRLEDDLELERPILLF